MHNPEDNLIVINTHREITRLYKYFLEIVEDMRNEHPECLSKEKYESIRKKILDGGNETSRQMITFLDFFDFTINKEKVEAAASQKRITKKFVTSSVLVVK